MSKNSAKSMYTQLMFWKKGMKLQSNKPPQKSRYGKDTIKRKIQKTTVKL